MDFQSCKNKQDQFIKEFEALSSQEDKYHHVIELGRGAPSMPEEDRLDSHLVPGCQSLLYLKVECLDGCLRLTTHSDALISAGLAFLITKVYDGEPPEAVFKCPPLFIKEMGLLTALSPSRATGLQSLFKQLQKEAAQWIR